MLNCYCWFYLAKGKKRICQPFLYTWIQINFFWYRIKWTLQQDYHGVGIVHELKFNKTRHSKSKFYICYVNLIHFKQITVDVMWTSRLFLPNNQTPGITLHVYGIPNKKWALARCFSSTCANFQQFTLTSTRPDPKNHNYTI